jgi:hypothetical protein
MLKNIDSLSWNSLPQPKENSPNEIPLALRFIADASTEQDTRDAYNRLLYAMGNNHGGTYFPVALLVIPLLGEIIAEGSALSRETALDVLVDLAGAFFPEPGFETFRQSPGSLILPEALHAEIVKLIPVVQSAQRSHQTTARERELAQDFFAQLGVL